MNKLGFYIENTTVPFLRDALRQAKPPTILIHAGDRGLLRDIRGGLSPDSFVVGRIFVELQQQTTWLDSSDPERHGREFADTILNFDFGLATEKGANDRLLIDAWMSLNEALRGPASFPNYQVDATFRRRAETLDRFQVAFRERLQSRGLEAVAFNFAAGNFTYAPHYLDWFPRTLESYIYLGFHEYGWPTLMEDPSKGSATSALFYRRCLEGIRQRYGDRHRVIITEAGLARMYKYPNDPAGDVGWLYPGETIPEEQYWQSLKWYNDELCGDDYVLGCCLFEVGHAGRWETFRHLGVNNQGQPILLISRIEKLREEAGPPRPPPPPPEADLDALRESIAKLRATLAPAIQQNGELLTQVAKLQRTLDDLAEVAAQAASLPQQVNHLLARVKPLQARVEQLEAGEGGDDLDTLRTRLAEVETKLTSLQPAAQQGAELVAQVAQARSALAPLLKGAEEAAALQPQMEALLAEVERLEAKAGLTPGGEVPQPPLQDVRTTLPVHASQRWPTRRSDAIQRLIVHHTVTRADVTPEVIAQAHVKRDKPGITYHFLVTGDGTITWTQPLEAVVEQTLVSAVNDDGVAVALAGNFMEAVPTAAQMDSAARLIAWLLSTLRLGLEAVYGRNELDTRVSSPGTQWLQGAQFKETLLRGVRDVLEG